MVLSAEVLGAFDTLPDTEVVEAHSSVCLEPSHSNSKGPKSVNVVASSKHDQQEDPSCLDQSHATLDQSHSSSKGLNETNSFWSARRGSLDDPNRTSRVQIAVARAVNFGKKSAKKPPPQWNCFKDLDWDWRPAAVQQLFDELIYEDWALLLRRPRVAVADTDVTFLDLLKEAKQKLLPGDSDYGICLDHLRKWLEDARLEQAMRCVPQPPARPSSACAKVMRSDPRRRAEQNRLDEIRSQEAAYRREEADRIAQEQSKKSWKIKEAKHRHIIRGKVRARQEEVLAKSEMRRSQSSFVLQRKLDVEESERQQTALLVAESEIRSVLARQNKAVAVKNRAQAAREENQQWRQIAEEIRIGKEMYEEAQRAAKWRAATQELQSNYVNASDIREEALRERADECRRKRELREDVAYGLREAAPMIAAITKAHLQQPPHSQGSQLTTSGSLKDSPDGTQSARSSIKTRGPLPTEQLVEQIRATVGSSWKRNVMGG